jgi:hypothetical protein
LCEAPFVQRLEVHSQVLLGALEEVLALHADLTGPDLQGLALLIEFLPLGHQAVTLDG